MQVRMFAAPLILVALVVALVVVPALQRRAAPHAKQRRRMEQARAEYRRSAERF
jgi:hypothetical protein